jgi:hypothetical protein
MDGLRFFRVSIAAAVVALACVPTISAQPSSEKPAAGKTCKIYSLAEMGNDPELCKWIADTIPLVIQPDSWALTGPITGNTLSYYAPAKVLVVHNTPAVHAQIDEFLQTLKKAMPPQKAAKHARPTSEPPVVQAQFVPSGPPPAPPSPPQYQSGYPVPMQPSQPKHLFHFIIRYEGDGIIDQNVVRFTKAMTEAAKAEANRSNPVPAPPPTVAQSPNSGTPLPSPSYSVPPGSAPSVPPMAPTDLPPPSEKPAPPPPPPLPF